MTPELRDKLLHFCNDNEPFLTHNYMRMTDADDGTATIVLPMQENSLNRWGGAHGGILFSLCDVATGMAIMSVRQEKVVTVNASIDYLAAASAGSTLTAVGGWTAWAESWPSAPPRSPTKRGKWWCAPTR